MHTLNGIFEQTLVRQTHYRSALMLHTFCTQSSNCFPQVNSYRIPKCKPSRYKYSFIPLSIKELNQRMYSHAVFYRRNTQLDRLPVAGLSCLSDCVCTCVCMRLCCCCCACMSACVSSRRKVAGRCYACVYVCL